VPDRHPHGAFDQGFHGDAGSGVTPHYFSKPLFAMLRDQRAVIGTATRQP
jgi:hypothetical protein